MPVAGRLEYIIDLNDAALVPGIQRVNAQFRGVAQQQQATYQAMGTAATQAGQQIDQSMARSTRAVQNHGAHSKNVFEMIAWRLKYLAVSATVYAGTAGIGAVTAAFGYAAKAGLEFNDMMEKSTIAFTSMLGSASMAADTLGRLYYMASQSPFTFEDYVTGAQRLIAYGVAAEDLEETLLALADATAAVGGSTEVFGRMSFSLGQMVSQGKITAREMRELAMAGIPAWQVLAEQLHTTVGELQKISETAGISAEVGIPALLEGIEERFGGMTKRMVDTYTGVTTTIKDMIKQAAGFAEEGMFENLKSQMIDIRNWLTEFNDEAKRVGFLAALQEQAPAAYDAITTISAELEILKETASAAGRALSSAWSIVPPGLKDLAGYMLQMGTGALILSKLVPLFVALKSQIMGMAVVRNLTAAWTAYNSAMATSLTLGQGWVATMGAGARAALATINPLTMVTAAVAALGFGVLQYKKHLEEVEREQQLIVDGAKTLVVASGGSWLEVAEAADTAKAKVADFAEQNEKALGYLRTLTEESAKGLLFSYAVEMQVRGMDRGEVQNKIDELAQAAGLVVSAPVGVDVERTLENFNRHLELLLPQLQEAWETAAGGGWTREGWFAELFGGESRGFFGQYETQIKSLAQAYAGLAKAGEWEGLLNTFDTLSEYPEVLRGVTQAFGEFAGVEGLAAGGAANLDSVMTELLADIGQSEAVHAMAEAFLEARAANKSQTEAVEAGTAAYAVAVGATDALTSATKDYTAALEEAAEAAAALWQKELDQVYNVGDVISDALQRKQAAYDADAAAAQKTYDAQAEAQKKAIDAAANADIAAIERRRDARQAEIDAEQDALKEQQGLHEKMGDIFGARGIEERIDALSDEKDAVKAQADAEKEAVRERTAAQKDAIQTVKAAAKEATLSVGEITSAIIEAQKEGDEYIANMATLPQEIREAIRDSGLSQEDKRRLAQEMVGATPDMQEAALDALRDFNARRSEEMATALGAFEAEMSALSEKAGEGMVNGLVDKLVEGRTLVFGAVSEYANEVARALNPILEALGEDQIPTVTGAGRVYGLPGVSPQAIWTRAQGGFLPKDATIQRPVGTRGLVQWAEPETQGEAFIPLAPQKRARSIGIWAQTGRLLGAFAGGGLLSPWEGMEDPVITHYGLTEPTFLPVHGNPLLSMAYAGNLGMGSVYSLADLWMKSSALGAGGGGSTSGMVPSTTAAWRAVKAMFPSATFLGGWANRPYKSDHTTGHAFDFDNPAVMSPGALWLASNAAALAIKYIIHNPLGIFHPGSGWKPYVPSASVRKFAGESAWHRDHVHVSTYDQGGFLMPGLNIAYNGTGVPEPVMSFANGGIINFGDFTGGTTSVTPTSSQQTVLDEAAKDYARAAAAAKVYAATLDLLAASGAGMEEQQAALNEQIAATEAQRDAAQTVYDLSKAAGMTDEEMADLLVTIIGLDTEIWNLGAAMEQLESDAETLARVALEDAIDGWAESLSHLSSLSRLYSYHSGSGGFLDALLPQQLGLLGNQYQNYMALGDSTGAIAALTEMFDLEREAIERGFADETAAVEQGGNARADAMRASVDALSDLLSDMRDEHQTELDDLRDYYDAKLELMDEEERELARRATASELASLYGAASKTTSDVARIQALREQQAKDERDERRRALTDARDAAIESLKSQQEAEEKRLQAQIDYQNKAMEQARRQAEAAHNAQLAALEKSQQQQLDLLVERYAELIGIAMGTAEQITGAAVHAAGGTGTAGGTWSTVGSTPSVPTGSTPSVPAGSTPTSTSDRLPGESLMEYLYRVNGAPGGENVIYGDGPWDPEYQWNPFIGAYEPVGSYTGSTYASNDWWRQYDSGGWLMPGKTLAVNNTGQPERVLAPGQGLQIGGEVTVRLVTDGPVTVTQEVADRLCEQVSRQLGRAQYNARWQ